MASDGNGNVWVVFDDTGLAELMPLVDPSTGKYTFNLLSNTTFSPAIVQLRFAAGTAWVLKQDGHLASAHATTTTMTLTDATGMAFDGTYMWVANGTKTVALVRPATSSTPVAVGLLPLTFSLGTGPTDLFFDGIYLWGADTKAGVIYQIVPSTRQVIHEISVPKLASNKASMVFDGFYMWVGSTGGKIWKINQNGAIVAGYAVSASDLAFDGRTIFAVEPTSGNVTQLRACDGFNVGKLVLPAPVSSIVFSGSRLWMIPQNPTKTEALFIR